MKRNIVMAALATLAAGSAMAQSSVTLYGRVNETIERVKNGDEKLTKLNDNTSFWGLKGVEDLGGGLKASFLLEAAFDASTGAGSNQGGTFFGRESWVAVGSDSLGRVRLGNVSATAFYYATADYVGLHNHDVGTSADAFFLYVGDSKNTIAYDSPTILGGLTVQYQLGLKETSSGGKNTSVFALNWDSGPYHLGAGYVQGPVGFGAFDPSVVGSSAFIDSNSYGLRALVELGNFTVGGYVNRDNLDDKAGFDADRTTFRLVAKYTIGSGDIHLDAGRANNWSGTSETGAEQYTIAYNYNLSKRTKLYTYYTRVSNDDNIGYAGQAPGDTFSSFAVGIRHWF